MYLRYAENILRGYGIAWNPGGPQTYGATSLLYLGIITAAKATLPLPQNQILIGVSWGAMLLFLIVMSLILFREMRSSVLRGSLIPIALTVLWCVANRSFRANGLNGMETSVALLANALFLGFSLAWLRAPSAKSAGVLALCGLISFLARPDNLVHVLLFPLLLRTCHAEKRDIVRDVFCYCGLLLSLLVIDTILKTLIFGAPLPLPFFVKTSGFYEGFTDYSRWNWVTFLYSFLMLALPFLALMVFSWRRDAWRTVVPSLLPTLVVFLYFSTVVQIMGFYGRYDNKDQRKNRKCTSYTE